MRRVGSTVSDTLPPLRTLRAAARAAWPELDVREFRVYPGGWDNLAVEADGVVVFRYPRRRISVASLKLEARILGYLSTHLAAPVPTGVRLGTLPRPWSTPFLAYRKIPGEPLARLRTIDSVGQRRLGRFVGTLLGDLASLRPRTLLRMGARAGDAGTWARDFQKLQRRFNLARHPLLTPSLRDRIALGFSRFYSDLATSAYRPVASHMDLGSEHILWSRESNRPSGVIDWGDFRLGDPAFDLTGLSKIAPERHSAWIRARRASKDLSFERRLAFYRRLVPLHGLLYAFETHDTRAVRRYVRALESAFEPG